jgi:predicted O-methyltransferase YrrM
VDQRLLDLRQNAKQNGEPILRDKSFELLLQTIAQKKPKTILEIGDVNAKEKSRS